MSTLQRLTTNLLTAARAAARAAEVSEPLRKRLSICAIEVVRAEAWNELETALSGASAEVREHVQAALEYAVEHPVLVDRQDRAFNGRLFLLPISQVLHGSTALGYLPQGELIQQLLTDALCPGGVGILLNRLLPEDVLARLSLKDVWTMTCMAFDRIEPGSAEAPAEAFLAMDDGETSGLHFVPFLAFAPSEASDELLSLEGDDLSVRSLAVMAEVNPLISRELEQSGHADVQVCVHIPLSFFYDPLLVDLAHEAFLFAVAMNHWADTADEEGRPLRLDVTVEREASHMDVLVIARVESQTLGEYRFPVDLDDDEMLAEVCINIEEIARPREVPVELPPSLRTRIQDEPDPTSKTLAFVDGPSTLQ